MMNSKLFNEQETLTAAELRSTINSQRYLPVTITSNSLRRYFLRKWHTTTLLALVKEGCINFEGTKFQIAWYGGKVAATSEEYCFMSFREPYGKLIMPVVLITYSKESEHANN